MGANIAAFSQRPSSLNFGRRKRTARSMCNDEFFGIFLEFVFIGILRLI
jgi:hypothetical protein